MKRFFTFAALLLVVTVPILLQPSAAQEQEVPESDQPLFTRAIVEAMTEAHRQNHRDNFHPVSLFLPYYSIAPGVETSVSVLNRFSDSFVVTLTAFSANGEAHSPINLEIAGSSQASVLLNEVLSDAGTEFVDGSVRLDYPGEEQLLSAWAVLRTESQATQSPFTDPSQIQSRNAHSFWDTRPFDKGSRIEPVYVLLNCSDSVLEYAATVVTSADGNQESYEGKLPPQTVDLLLPIRGHDEFAAGSIIIDHDGLAGDLISIGLLQGESFLNSLPVFHPETHVSTQYHSVRMPLRSRDSLGNPVPMRGLVSAFNSTQEHHEATVLVFDPNTGEELTRHAEILEPAGVKTLDIGDLLAAVDTSLDGDSVRVAVTHSGEPGSVLLSARSVGSDNQEFYVPLIGVRSAHHNGMVPLPGLDDHFVVTTLTNLGSESAGVVAQIDWEGGSYALPSITIEPGASHRIDIAQLAQNGPPDILGRVLDPEYQNAVLRWSSRAGSLSLIARTEADIIGGGHFGFQGAGCCFEAPYGGLLPRSPVFEVGESIDFQASEFRATCTGTMGPFAAEAPSLDYESNFDWTGSILSATSPGEGQFGFIATSYAIDSSCSADYADYGDQANATAESAVGEDPSTGKERERLGVAPWDEALPVGPSYSTAGVGGPPAIEFLVIDAESIKKDEPPNFFSEQDVNLDLKEIGVRTQLRFFEANVGATITLRTGQEGDFGWIALQTVPASWVAAGPTSDGFRNFFGEPGLPVPHNVGPGLGAPDSNGDRESLLDNIPNVLPLGATELQQRIGQRVCAVVYDSDVSVWSMEASLKGANLGTVAFEVVAVTPQGGSTLPEVDIKIFDSRTLCADTTSPVITFTSPAAGSFIATNVPTLGLSFSDDAIGVDTSTLAIQLGGNALGVSCTFTATTATCTPLSGLPEGLVNLTATIADFEGNVSAPAALSFSLDTIAPVITLNSPQDGDQVDTEEINFVGSLNQMGTLTLDGNPVMLDANKEFDHGPVTLIEGANVFQLVATDLAGNTTTAAITVTFVMPSSFSFDPIGEQTVDVGTTLSLTLTATDPSGNPVTFGTSTLPLPGGATLDAATGLFTFTPTSAEVGAFSVTFFATNGDETLFQTIQITVPAPDPSNPTSFTGQLLDANDFELGTVTPIVGATVSFLNTGISDLSDGNGFVTLTGLPSGSQILDIDSTTAALAPDGSNYAGFREQFVVEANSANVVSRPFFLPRIDDSSLTTVDPNATTIVTNVALGVSITIPPHTAKNPDGTDFTGQMSISEVPRGLAPAPLPDTLDPALLVTIQPVGVTFATPVPITFPNLDQLAVGNEVDIWSLDPATGSFSIVGTGAVSADGQSLETISGGVRAADWQLNSAPECDGSEEADEPNCGCGNSKDPGSRANTRGGWLSTDFSIPDYRSQGQSRGLRFVYRSERAHPRPVLPFDGTVVSRAAVPVTLSYQASVGGVSQGGETFVNTAGFDDAQDETMRGVIALDGTNLPTGLYPYTIRLTSNYLSTRVSTTFDEQVVVINEQASPLGAGWGISGLTRLYPSFTGRVLIVGGDGSQRVFLPAPLDLNDWQEAGNTSFSEWIVAPDGKSVFQDFRAFSPTFFISPNNFINTTLSGKFRVENTADKNFIGLVFGYRSAIPGNGDPDTTHRMILFDWKKQTATQIPGQEGYALTRLEGVVGFPNDVFFAHVPSANAQVLGTNYGSTLGWTEFTDHFFTLQYDTDRIVITIDGVQIFDVAGSFPPGRFGFYDLFQENVRYELFEVGSFTSLDGDFSELIGYEDGTFSRTLKNGTRFEYDANGLQTAILDRNGNTTTYAYDGQDRLISITDPVGKVTTLAYSGNNLASVTDPANRVTTFAHDADGNMTQVTFPDSTSRSFGYDSRHLMTSETNARNLTTTRQYDFTGRFIQSTRPDNSTRQATNMQTVGLVDPASGFGTAANPAPFVRPDAAISTFTDGNGHVQTFETDGFGKLTRMTDANNLTTITDRDADGNPIRTVRPNGSEILRTFDANGNLLTVTEGFNGAVTSTTHDPTFNLLTSITDPRGNTTTFTRDAKGNVIQMTNDLGHITSLAYNSQGLVTQMTEPNGLVMTYTYSAADLLAMLTETPPPGGGLTRTTTFTYDAAGQITQIITPDGITLTLDYDPHGRLIRITDNLNQKIEFAYDGEGNRIRTDVKDPDGTLATTVQETFDNLNRLLTVAQPHVPGTDSITQLQYDNSGNATGQTDPNGNVSSGSYDPGDRLAQNTDAASGSTAYVYDDNGNITQVSAPNGAITTYTFDASSRRLTEASPDRGNLTYSYDLADNLVSTTDARGITATFSYDDLNRVTSVVYPDATENVAFVYDSCPFGIGRICDRTDESGSYDFMYDVYGNFTQVDYTTLGVTHTTTYQYDAEHRVISMTLPSGRTVTYQRDGLGRISGIDADISGINTTLVSNITYRADSLVTARQYGNGIAETRIYDQQRRLTQQTIGTADSVLFSYDANSSVLSRDTQTNTHTYGYDVLDRLEAETNDGATIDYTYDPNYNRLTKDDGVQVTQYAYGAGSNQLVGIDAAPLSYDLAGNLTDNGQGQTYVHNDANRLSQLFDNAVLTATYVYNAPGQRMHKTTSAGTTVFHYDLAGRLIGETRDDGTPLRDYVWQDYSAIAQIEGDAVVDTLTYLHPDQLGTPRLGTDLVGNVVWRWEGTVFGVAVGRDGLWRHPAGREPDHCQPAVPGPVRRCGIGPILQLESVLRSQYRQIYYLGLGWPAQWSQFLRIWFQ